MSVLFCFVFCFVLFLFFVFAVNYSIKYTESIGEPGE